MPPNPQNLKPWPKGVSGNPGGRPKKRFQDVLDAELDAKPELVKALIQKGIKEALKGDFRYWSALFDRVDGKTVTKTEITIPDMTVADLVTGIMNNGRNDDAPPADERAVDAEQS